MLAILISEILLAAITGVIVYRRSGLSVSAQVPMFVAPSNELGWKQDLHYMTAEIPRRHVNAFHTLTRAQFDRVVSELDSAIPTLDKDQIVVGLMRITTMLGDGHSADRDSPKLSLVSARSLLVWEHLSGDESGSAVPARPGNPGRSD